jgi:hypothetical protein
MKISIVKENDVEENINGQKQIRACSKGSVFPDISVQFARLKATHP